MKRILFSLLLLLILVGCGGSKNTQIEQLRRQLDSLTINYAQASYRADSLEQIHFRAIDSLRNIYADSFNGLVHIRYRNPIHGYRVSALWHPEYVGYQGKIIGKAILYFKKEDVAFSMVHSHFFLQGEQGNSKSEHFSFNYDKVYEVTYHTTASTSYLRADVPFFFVDGNEKLVLTMWHEGQKAQHAYQFYKMEYDGACIQNGLGQITHERPYSHIDDSTDITKDQIIIHTHSGAFYWTKEYYQRPNDDQEYELRKIERCEEDTIYTYRPLELIGTRRITQ